MHAVTRAAEGKGRGKHPRGWLIDYAYRRARGKTIAPLVEQISKQIGRRVIVRLRSAFAERSAEADARDARESEPFDDERELTFLSCLDRIGSV